MHPAGRPAGVAYPVAVPAVVADNCSHLAYLTIAGIEVVGCQIVPAAAFAEVSVIDTKVYFAALQDQIQAHRFSKSVKTVTLVSVVKTGFVAADSGSVDHNNVLFLY